jgi:hypothetical protein
VTHIFAALLPGISPRGETAHSADPFVDSVGVSVHIHFGDTSYADFPAVKEAPQ